MIGARKEIVDTVKEAIYSQSTSDSCSRSIRLTYDDVDDVADKVADYAEQANIIKVPNKVGIVHMSFFSTTEQLSALTGLTRDELWKEGFNLDDMDFGIQADVPLDDNREFFERWLLRHMESHCVGYCVKEYAGRCYYTVHHS